ncbi:hypothetical protein [Amycolatopsis thermoflava]|nr:hypothetical protein [Amycolatopsis thermoflava]
MTEPWYAQGGPIPAGHVTVVNETACARRVYTRQDIEDLIESGGSEGDD